ncbi:hypothetical protein, variant [Aphanomyces invadans]|uniref:Uncharacterized protein n=1 Tax=Aphanomyces invadans TaxID=157072 RepID=A0A024TL70_9STRA|nr:hypothetical protein, variant [Aphanomyces invadans]ETV94783.1 hypothetical protein, variant [Aphanomyces invadans]|eukprot:XP_008876727.1 hypothetical protein, variant [Aphanomyces invadans]
MNRIDALAYDPEDLEELLNFSGSDSEAEVPPSPHKTTSNILPPLHFVDMPDQSPYLSAKKESQLQKFGVLNSPFGKFQSRKQTRSSPVPSLRTTSPFVKKKGVSPWTRFVPQIDVGVTSPSKMVFKTNDIVKHGELKVYMCRYKTIQPLFCIPFRDTTTLQSCRTRIDDLLMVDAVEYVFVAPTGKSIAVSAEGRFLAHWFYPVLTILVTNVINQSSHHQSPEKLQQAISAMDKPASTEKPWNLSYSSFGMFSSKELRMQSAIIQSPMSKKIRKRQQRDALRVSLESPSKTAEEFNDAFEPATDPAMDTATVRSILKRSKFDVLEHFTDREVQRRKDRHAKYQRKALVKALALQEKAVVLQCWWRTMLSYRLFQEKKQAHLAAIRIQTVMRQRSLQKKQMRSRRNSIMLNKTPSMKNSAHHYVFQAFEGNDKIVVKLQAIQRRRLAQKQLRENPEKAERYLELERRREMVRKSQENFERERALAQLRKLHAKERKERKELNKLALATRRERAAVSVQTTYRRYRAGKMVHILRRERKAAIKIQSHLRKNTALTRVETLKLQMRKSSLSGTTTESESYHPRLFCRRVWFRGAYHILYSCLSKGHLLLVLHCSTSGKQGDPIALECAFDVDDLKLFGLLPSTLLVRIHELDRLTEGASMALVLSRGQYVLNQQDFHNFRNLTLDARTLLLPNPDMYFGRMYQRCSDSNPPNELLRCFRYSEPTLIYYLAKRVKLGMAHLGFFEDKGVLYVECYISRWHICICVGLQYQEWAFTGHGILARCDLNQKIEISKHMGARISIGHNGVRLEVRRRLFHIAKRFRIEEDGVKTSATALFSVYILGTHRVSSSLL